MTIPMVMRTVRCRMSLPPPLFGSLKRRKPNNERDQRIVTAVTNGADFPAGPGGPGAGPFSGWVDPMSGKAQRRVPNQGFSTDPLDPVYGVPRAAGPWWG